MLLGHLAEMPNETFLTTVFPMTVPFGALIPFPPLNELTFVTATPFAALTAIWRRRPGASEVTFDGSEPLIQTLDLN
jgi:hypothetical protein